MKTKIFKAPGIFTLFFLALSILFSACDPENGCPCNEENDEDTTMLRKPNIYIYPEAETFLDVELSFPQGGEVTTSIPEYGNGWSVNVEPDGTIDGEYTFLFYESMQPNLWQYDFGWVKPADELEAFFRQNLSDYGFAGQEIEDFMEYWMPLLQDHPWYAIYPQNKLIIDAIVELKLSEEPDHLQRLYYVIEGLDNYPESVMTEPTVGTEFRREGFFVLEWGGVLLGD